MIQEKFRASSRVKWFDGKDQTYLYFDRVQKGPDRLGDVRRNLVPPHGLSFVVEWGGRAAVSTLTGQETDSSLPRVVQPQELPRMSFPQVKTFKEIISRHIESGPGRRMMAAKMTPSLRRLAR